ncbi:ABC transporter ATP-binding protein [Mobilicoccus massiliensis]|uniref:ABC transporter ATP-binding protein n=1 Tax=Mobilicoccus massiliensis TaxID=1522310 RepID=UPI000693E7C8|nr:ABC transporter ATP-binding protein [Mobilicoccus massiliensis]
MFTRTSRPAPKPVVTTGDLVASALVKTYPGAGIPALDGVGLAIAGGETVAIMGPSGSGKTTLLHLLAGVLTPTSGAVLWGGRDLATLGDADRTRLRRTDFGFVFQSGHLLPELPAIENAALPLMLAGLPRAEATARAATLFAPLGLETLTNRRPGELSGGQAQRVAIARALVGDPGVVFADEPTGALDQQTGADVMHHLVTRCRAAGSSLVVVTHDENVARWCERTVRLRDGRVVADERPVR